MGRPNSVSRKKLVREAEQLLERESIVLAPSERARFLREILNTGRRYAYTTCKHWEKGTLMRRFLKFPVDRSRKNLELFTRSVEFAKAIKKGGRIKTRGIIKANTNASRGPLFSLVETFPPGRARVGFIKHSGVGSDAIGRKEAKSCVRNLILLHEMRPTLLPRRLKRLLRRFDGTYGHFSREVGRFLNARVSANRSSKRGVPFSRIYGQRMGIPDFRERVIRLMRYWKKLYVANEERGTFFLHGDMSPSNIYVYDSGEVELLDFEWAGKCNNPIAAMVVDFGNLHARAWNAPSFRRGMEEALIRQYVKRGKEDAGRAIVSLGILRSHLLLSGFFENYPIKRRKEPFEAKRRKNTEKDLLRVWEVAGIDRKHGFATL